MRTGLVVGVLIVGAGAARADQLGLDFGGGPVVRTHGPLTDTFAPDMWSRMGMVYTRGAWSVEGSVVAMADLRNDAGAVGGTVAAKRASLLHARTRRGVRVAWQAYGTLGWTALGVVGPPVAEAGRVMPAEAGLAVGPRIGAGLELVLSLSRRRVTTVSRIALDVNHQTLRGDAQGGGYAFAQLSLITTVGR